VTPAASIARRLTSSSIRRETRSTHECCARPSEPYSRELLAIRHNGESKRAAQRVTAAGGRATTVRGDARNAAGVASVDLVLKDGPFAVMRAMR
jgi:hypothetical protein